MNTYHHHIVQKMKVREALTEIERSVRLRKRRDRVAVEQNMVHKIFHLLLIVILIGKTSIRREAEKRERKRVEIEVKEVWRMKNILVSAFSLLSKPF